MEHDILKCGQDELFPINIMKCGQAELFPINVFYSFMLNGVPSYKNILDIIIYMDMEARPLPTEFWANFLEYSLYRGISTWSYHAIFRTAPL